MRTNTVVYAEIDETGERQVIETTQGTCLHLTEPKPLAWGYFTGKNRHWQAKHDPLPGLDEARYNRFIETTEDFAALDKVRDQIADVTSGCE